MERLSGFFLIVFAAVCFGTNVLAVRLAYDDGTNPMTYLLLRFGLAALFLSGISIVQRKSYPRGKLLIKLILFGVGMGLCCICYFTALTMASASLVVVLTYTYPAMVTIVTVLVYKKKLTLTVLTALSMTLGGVILTAGTGWQGQFAGIVLSIFSAITFAAFILLAGSSLRAAGTVPASAIMMLASTMVFAMGVMVTGIEMPTTRVGWGAVILSALFISTIGVLAFNAGLERIESATAAMLATLEVVVAIGLSIIFLGEIMTPAKYIGAALILGATLLLAKSEIRPAAGRVVPAPGNTP